jgi:signal transduction histidine kinase
MRPHRWTVRARLTAIYGTLFLLAGAALLAITYLLLGQALQKQNFDETRVLAVPGIAVTRATPLTVATRGAASADLALPTGITEQERQEIEGRYELAQNLQNDFRQATLTSLLQQGSIALVGVALVGIWLGWVTAGRTLRPIQQITETARRVADRTLHERIGLTGPRDELRRLADTFDDMLARLDAAFDSQRRFVANASHELRTPLAINRTLLEVALSRPDAPAEVRQLGETMLAVNARHERLIDGLLLLARTEQDITDPVPVDLAQVAGRLVDAARPAGVELTLTATPTPVSGDPVLLEHLVRNLLSNAVAYNVRPGRVDVTCEPGRLTVTNTGPVIAAYEIPRLFEPFQRLTDRVGSAHGTGLGLSIVRSVARAHGAEVTAEPGPRGGLTVTVTLPPAPGSDHLTSRSRPVSTS